MPVALTRFGPYEVVGLIGAGGMGEVYRARDPRLNRDVALKILSTAPDPIRQQRFLDEARAAGALNHPNILAVYDVGTEHGSAYIVTELVDGESLRELMMRGPVSARAVLDIAIQIGDGMAAAHEAAIVHRDLKPENVMVTRDGRVKIVDFGLAKIREPEPKPADAPNTRRATLTDAALIAGTAPYMSPEQARGGAVDFRSDQFSFGLMLYELATGRVPFERQTPVETLAAIIQEEVTPVGELNPKVPASLRRVIDRCLRKDPRHRYAASADLAYDLRTLRDGPDEATSRTASVDARHRRRWIIVAPIGFLVLALAVLSVAVVELLQPEVADLSNYRYVPFATNAGYQGAPAWSPDGKTVAYVAEVDGIVQVFTRSLTASAAAQVTHGNFHCRDPFWSPDGTRILYISRAADKEGIWSVSLAGGTPENVMENAGDAAISPDGKTLAFFRDEISEGTLFQTLWLSSPPGAEPTKYEHPPFATGYAHAVFHFAPDGSKLGIWTEVARVQAHGGSKRQFWIVPLPTGDPSVALPMERWTGVAHFNWLPDSRRIVIALIDPGTPGTHLWLGDTKSQTLRPLTISTSDENFPAVSPTGDKIALTVERADFDLIEIFVNGSPARPLLATSRNEEDPASSAVRSEFAFVTDRTGSSQIWLRSFSDQRERPLVTENDFPEGSTNLFAAPAISPDGERIAYNRFGHDGNSIWISTLAGGRPVRLTTGVLREEAPSWSPDGNSIAFVQGVLGHWSLVTKRVGSREPPLVVRENVLVSARPQWSPTGAWIACDDAEGLFLVSPDGKVSRSLSEQTWLAYGWVADGSRLVGIRGSDDARSLVLASIDVRTGEERIIQGNVGPIPLASSPIRGFSRTPNNSFATGIVRVWSDIWLLEGFRTKTSFVDRFWPKRR